MHAMMRTTNAAPPHPKPMDKLTLDFVSVFSFTGIPTSGIQYYTKAYGKSKLQNTSFIHYVNVAT